MPKTFNFSKADVDHVSNITFDVSSTPAPVGTKKLQTFFYGGADRLFFNGSLLENESQPNDGYWVSPLLLPNQ